MCKVYIVIIIAIITSYYSTMPTIANPSNNNNIQELNCSSSGACVHKNWKEHEYFQCDVVGWQESCCLWHTNICDGTKNCRDGSDEDNNMCRSRVCPVSDMFRCDSGQCLYVNHICDGVHKTSFCSDESHIGKVKCPTCPVKKNLLPVIMFQCDSLECVYNNTVCDKNKDCPDGSDESPMVCPEDLVNKGQEEPVWVTIGPTSGSILISVLSILFIILIVLYLRRRFHCCYSHGNSSPRTNSKQVVGAQSTSTLARPLPRPPSAYQSVYYTPDGYIVPDHYHQTSNAYEVAPSISGNSYITITNPTVPELNVKYIDMTLSKQSN